MEFDALRLISLVPIQPYHNVADIGCGKGTNTVPLAKFLFDGKVYALDVQQEMLDATREAAEAVRLANVEVMLSKQDRLPLEDESLDGALVAFVLHHTDKPRALLEDTRRCLKKSGWLAILESSAHGTDEAPRRKGRADEEGAQAMVQKAGFRFGTRRDLGGGRYMVLARK